MKPALTLFLLMFFTSVFSQADEFKAPDYKQIEKNVKDKNSPYYFKTLFERYSKADTTMTTEERRHLYYGYSYQKEFSPYEQSDAQEELNAILQKKDSNNKDLEELIKVSAKVLEHYPFSIRLKEYRVYALKELGRLKEAEKEMAQAGIIIDAILSTGDGTTKDKCFYVINTMNEYEVLDILGFSFGGKQQLLDSRYDYLTVADNPYNLEGFYFDVSRSLDALR